LQEFQHFEIVPFNEEIVRIVLVHAFARLRHKSPFGGESGKSTGFTLPWPEQPEVFLSLIFESLAEGFTERVPVNTSVRKGFGEDGLQFAEAVFGQREYGVEFGERHKILKGEGGRMRDEI
jgi:hypothetical protein